MQKGDESLIFADCGINVNPSSEELKDIATKYDYSKLPKDI